MNKKKIPNICICTNKHLHILLLTLSAGVTTITDSTQKVYSYPTPRVDPGSAVLTAAGGVLCGLLGVGIGMFQYTNFCYLFFMLLLCLRKILFNFILFLLSFVSIFIYLSLMLILIF